MIAGLRGIKFTVMDVKRDYVTVVCISICEILTVTPVLIMIFISAPTSALHVSAHMARCMFFLFAVTSKFCRSIYRCYVRLPAEFLWFLLCVVSMLHALFVVV
jgi:hypothetical protein